MQISLNGDWQFKGYYGEDWRWRDAHKPQTRDLRHWQTGHVPGTVQDDLWRAGAIPDPYFEQNTRLIEWIPDRTWLYKRMFFVPDDLRGKRARLCFEGVDYDAEFFLNGESLGTHRSMYTPAAFDVTGRLIVGADNLIAVVIERAPDEQPQVGRTSLVRTHKSRMTYWWDFCPRMIHVGIWQDVYLEVAGGVRIADAFIRPQLNADFTRADVSAAITLDAAAAQTVAVDVVLTFAGEVVAREQVTCEISAGQSAVDLSLAIDDPQLWYPNGAGDQPLYNAEIVVMPTSGGEPSDNRAVVFGIRQITLAHSDSAEPDALPYTFVVNGRKRYANGWNWVPLDVMYGVPRPDKLEHLLTLAKRANVNLLRVWGGGLIETEAFYNLADRLGIMVWQEFIQSSSGIDNFPPEAPEHIAFMVREAEQIIPRRRNHPSLALWCGGNELTGENSRPLDDSHPLLAALKAVVSRLDPDRLWLATSPTGRVFSNSLEEIQRDPNALHDVHGPWEYQGVTGQYDLYNAGSSLLHSEFGVEGMTNRKSLDATIAPEHQAPVSLENPLWEHLGAWWVKEKVWRATFGEVADVETLRRATQFMQADGLRYALEADRRRQWHNSGTLPWQFNEPYPMAACTSSVDYYGQPKPAYYAVAHAYEPVHVSAKLATIAWGGRETFSAEIWASNARETPIPNALLIARIVGSSGRIYADQTETITIAANGSAPLTTVAYPLADVEDVFFLDLALADASGAALSRNRYVFTRAADLAPLLRVPPTTLAITASAGGVTITNTGGSAALFVWLEDARPVSAAGYVDFSDNHVCLLPGERQTISASWRDVFAADRALRIGGWNTGDPIQQPVTPPAE